MKLTRPRNSFSVHEHQSGYRLRGDIDTPTDWPGETVNEYQRSFDGYTITIREYVNHYGGRSVAHMRPTATPEPIEGTVYRRQSPEVSVFATGASLKDIEAFLSACFLRTRHLKLKRL